MKITVKLLHRWDACEIGVDWFEKRFPNGFDTNNATDLRDLECAVLTQPYVDGMWWRDDVAPRLWVADLIFAIFAETFEDCRDEAADHWPGQCCNGLDKLACELTTYVRGTSTSWWENPHDDLIRLPADRLVRALQQVANAVAAERRKHR